jgi:hypothetical protein
MALVTPMDICAAGFHRGASVFPAHSTGDEQAECNERGKTANPACNTQRLGRSNPHIDHYKNNGTNRDKDNDCLFD